MPTRPLSFGEYCTSDETQALARQLFLPIVAELVPGVLATLRDDVLPVFTATYEEVATCATAEARAERRESYTQKYGGRRVGLCFRPHDVSWWHSVGRACLYDEAVIYPDLLRLREALEAWSTNHHLHEPWVHKSALVQLDAWREYPAQAADPDRLEWLVLSAGWSNPAIRRNDDGFVFEHPGWNPTMSSRSKAQAELRKGFESKLRDYLDALEARAVAAEGFERSKEYPSVRQHLEWIVRYQCMGESLTRIARETEARGFSYLGSHPTPRETVGKAVREKADLLDLHLRKARGGRPPKPAT